MEETRVNELFFNEYLAEALINEGVRRRSACYSCKLSILECSKCNHVTKENLIRFLRKSNSERIKEHEIKAGF